MYPVLKPTEPKPLMQIDAPNFCGIGKGDVYDELGNYLKSFCIDKYLRSYEESRVNCLLRDMQLYHLDTNEVPNALIDFADKNLVAFENSSFFIHGKTDSWCLNIHSENEKFSSGYSQCTENLLSVCEFVNVSL